MNNHALILRVDGTVQKPDWKKKPTLKQMQAAVGGYIELVGGNNRMKYVYEKCHMLVNEDGIALGLPQNAKATVLYHSICYAGCEALIYGDVVLLFGTWRLS